MNRLISLITFFSALLLSANVLAAPPKFSIKDVSTATLIDASTAKAIWIENLPERIAKPYPVKLWGYVSEVNGGFDEAKNCVIVARAMMLPMKRKSFVYEPKKTAVTYASRAGFTAEQCSDLAKTKLREAVQSVVAALISN
jgi:hypothetical protein